MSKKVIVTAHDFGLTTSVNEGIIYTLNHRNNILTELSLLVNAPGSEDALSKVQNHGVSIALNLNLISFKPLSDVPSMINKDGSFKTVDVSTWDFSSIDSYLEEDVSREIDAQWDWFVSHVGRKPSAILSRKNEIGDPRILLPLVKKAQKEHVPIRTPMWMWQENYGAQSYVYQEDVKSPENIFVLLKDWKGRFGYNLDDDLDRLIADVKMTSGVSELLVFPGFVDEELFEVSTLNWQRGQYIALLERDDIFDRLREEFEYIGFSDL